MNEYELSQLRKAAARERLEARNEEARLTREAVEAEKRSWEFRITRFLSIITFYLTAAALVAMFLVGTWVAPTGVWGGILCALGQDSPGTGTFPEMPHPFWVVAITFACASAAKYSFSQDRFILSGREEIPSLWQLSGLFAIGGLMFCVMFWAGRFFSVVRW